MIYIIKYRVFGESDNLLKQGKVKAKNASHEIEAKVKLEKYLQSKVVGFHRLVIDSCVEDNDILQAFGDIFGDIFGR